MEAQKKQKWAAEVATKLKAWCNENGYPQRSNLAHELRIDMAAWKRLNNGDSVLRGDAREAYAKLFLKTGLPIFDPRTIPTFEDAHRNMVSVAWSQQQWQDFLYKQQTTQQGEQVEGGQSEAEQLAEEATSTEKELAVEAQAETNGSTDWKESLSKALRRWLDENGYPVPTKLARELEIPAHIWTYVLNGKGISQDATIYARIFRRTGLTEADPRMIPPREVTTFGHVTNVERAWSEEQYQQWLKRQQPQPIKATATRMPEITPPAVADSSLSEIKELLKQLRAAQQTPPQTVTPVALEQIDELRAMFGVLQQTLQSAMQAPAPTSSSPQTLGGWIDKGISIVSGTIARQISTQLAQELSEQIRTISTQQELTPSVQTIVTDSGVSGASSLTIKQLLQELTRRLKRYIEGTPAQRDQLVDENIDVIHEFWQLFSPLTLPSKERERSLRQNREY